MKLMDNCGGKGVNDLHAGRVVFPLSLVGPHLDGGEPTSIPTTFYTTLCLIYSVLYYV